MTRRLDGAIAIVTGAGSIGPGIGNGKACAIQYAREGAQVIALDINEDSLISTSEIINKEGNQVTTFPCDVTDIGAVSNIIDISMKKYGRIDILHNNVGILDLEGPVTLSENAWNKIINTNITSVFISCKNVLPIMEEQGSGVIINISSVAAIRYWGVPAIAYNTSKAAILQFTKSIALQYAHKGIRANVILPGIIDTPLINEPLKNLHSKAEIEEIRKERHQMIPMGRMGDPFDIANAAVFLASQEASYITGTELIVDGGLTGSCVPNW